MIDTSICAVVPVYNAEQTLETLITKLDRVLSCFERYRIVLVDDASSDNSFEVMKRLHTEYPSVTAIALQKNSGQQSAVLCGLRQSDCEYTVILDDDLEHEPDDIIKLYAAITQGYDVIYGIDTPKASQNVGGFRRLGSRLRDSLFNRITKKPKDQKVCSFRIINRKTVDSIIKTETKFVYISMEILRHTVNISNVPVRYNKRAVSGYSALRLIALLMKMYIYYAPHSWLHILRKKGDAYIIKQKLEATAK